MQPLAELFWNRQRVLISTARCLRDRVTCREPPAIARFSRAAPSERIATCGVAAGAVARLQVVEERLAAWSRRVGLHHLPHAPHVVRDLLGPFSRARVRAAAAFEFLSINQHMNDKVSGRSSG